MALFEFRQNLIDDHVERIGIDVRPALDPVTDRVKLHDFAMWLTDTWPALYEKIVQGRSDFQVLKRFVFPGKGELEFQTFCLTDRGIVFSFPRRFAVFGEDTDLGAASDVVLEAMEKFKRTWPQCKHVRFGKVNEFVFDCPGELALSVLAGRFTTFSVPLNGELTIRANLRDEQFNRIVELTAVQKLQVDPTGSARVTGTGIAVKVDFNNQDMSEDLPKTQRVLVLQEADRYCTDGLYRFLNGEVEHDS